MSVLVYIETENGKIKKNTLETISYARDLASEQGRRLSAVVVNFDCQQDLSLYGVEHLIKVEDERLDVFLPQPYFELLSKVVEQGDYKTLIFSSSSNSRILASMLSAAFSAGYVPNVQGLMKGDTLNRGIFNNKIHCIEQILTPMKIISVMANSYSVKENKVLLSEQVFKCDFSSEAFDVKVEKIEKSQGAVSLSEASIVVSGGRGMKGSENWHLLESLACELNAALACSKPVSDMGWRPHSEHVGQTGKQIAPNVYIAVGISGAIQHLAGVDASKVKIVINSDAQAPFFKSADYGVVADAFEFLPKLIEALKS